MNSPSTDRSGGRDAAERTASLLTRRRTALGGAYRLFYREPVHVVRASGVWLEGPGGARYLDAYNNVASLGHGHPAVVEAMSAQAARLNVHSRYLTDSLVGYAEELLARFPAGLDRAMLTCTGSEANDLACRIAREATGGSGFVVTENAYHGVTSALAGMSPSLGAGVGPHVRTVRPPAAAPGDDPGAVATAFADAVRDAFDDLAAHGVRPAALVVDSVLASDGVVTDPPGFLAAAARVAREAGALYIADEVQAGFARLGTMWGFTRHGVVPDLVTLGKPMGNGYPVGGVVTREELTTLFGRRTRYFNTFGGNPVACAVASAVLEVIDREDLVARAGERGQHLRGALTGLAPKHPAIGGVRGAGLFAGVDIVDADGRPAPALAAAVVDGMRDAGVLIGSTGRDGSVLKIRPPLVFGGEHVEHLASGLDGVLEALGPDQG